LGAHEASLPIRHSLRKIAIVEAAIAIEQASLSAGQSVSPLAIGIVDQSFIIDSVGARFSDSFGGLKVGGWLEGFYLCLDFDDLGVKFGEAIDWYKIANKLGVLVGLVLQLVGLFFLWLVEEGFASVIVDLVGVLLGTALLAHRNYLKTN
jgi:hypothetical protein